MSDILDRLRGAVLFVSYGGGHAAALAPVVQELRRRDVPVAILALTTAAAYFRRLELDVIGVADLIAAMPDYADARGIGATLALGQPTHGAVPAHETEAYLGVGYRALERDFGVEEAKRRYAAMGRQAFRPFDFFKSLFALARPAAVVATSAPRSERAAIEAASAAGIPALCVVDLYAPFEIEWCAAPGFAQRICVLNDAVADRFIAHGVPRERLAVTGNPAFDRLGTLDMAAARATHRAALGLLEEDRLLVWISQPEPAAHPFSGIVGDPNLPLETERALAAAFADDPHVHIAMRLHPSEDRGPAVTGPRLRYGNATEPLDYLLAAADCVVTSSSTVGLEAALLGIPVVQITNSIFSPDLPLAELGFAIAAPDGYQAAGPIREIIGNIPGGERGSGHHWSNFDAARRVSDQIIDLL